MLIGLHGKMRAGKDTAYEMIRDEFSTKNRPVLRKSFAELLKCSAAQTLGLLRSDIDEFKERGTIQVRISKRKDEFEISGREFLQRYGTEAHREIFGDDFWIDQALPLDYNHKGQIVCVTDVRFDNEARRITQLGGEVWLIERPGGREDSHASERTISPVLIDYTIMNDGDLAAYKSKVLAQAETLIDRQRHLVSNALAEAEAQVLDRLS